MYIRQLLLFLLVSVKRLRLANSANTERSSLQSDETTLVSEDPNASNFKWFQTHAARSSNALHGASKRFKEQKLQPEEEEQMLLRDAAKRSAGQGNSAPGTRRKTMKMSEQEVIQRVLENYDWRVRPYGMNPNITDTGGPVIVTINLYLRSISKIDDVNMVWVKYPPETTHFILNTKLPLNANPSKNLSEAYSAEYSAQFTFRETWIDPRLAYADQFPADSGLPDFVVLATTDSSQQIWMPDTFFQNEKEARKHSIDKPNVLIRIHANGEILYSVRLSLVLSCPMNLEYYPLDRQTCLIDLASYAYTTADIKYEWKAQKPVQLKDGLNSSLPSFELQTVETDYCTSITATGTYSCLRTRLILRREFRAQGKSQKQRLMFEAKQVDLASGADFFSYYLLQLYIPSFMLVIVSWVSFWLDKDSVPARVTLGVTTLLTMTTQSSGINAKLPPVSYTKAIDVWIGVCLAFIFGALLEFALVNYAARRDSMEQLVAGRRGQRRNHLLNPPPAALNFMGQPMLYHSPLRGDLVPASSNNHHQMFINANSSGGHKSSSHSPRRTAGSSPGSRSNKSSSSSTRRKRKKGCFDLLLTKYKERSKRIDVISRLVFPVGFFMFNCIYWTIYMA